MIQVKRILTATDLEQISTTPMLAPHLVYDGSAQFLLTRLPGCLDNHYSYSGLRGVQDYDLIHKHDILAVLSGGADQWNAFRRRHTESIGLRLLTPVAQAAVKRKTAISAVPRFLHSSEVSFIASTLRASSTHRITRLLQQNRPLANILSKSVGLRQGLRTNIVLSWLSSFVGSR